MNIHIHIYIHIYISMYKIHGYCLLFCVLATYKVISGWVTTCDSAHSWWLYSVAPLGNQAASIMTWCTTSTRPVHHLPAHSERKIYMVYVCNLYIVYLCRLYMYVYRCKAGVPVMRLRIVSIKVSGKSSHSLLTLVAHLMCPLNVSMPRGIIGISLCWWRVNSNANAQRRAPNSTANESINRRNATVKTYP